LTHFRRLGKIFLFTGIPFGLVAALLATVWQGPGFGLWTGLAMGVIFGGFMAAILGFLHVRSVQQKGFSGASAYHVKQSKELVLPFSHEKAFSACLNSLKSLEKASLSHQDPSRGIIRARTGVTWDTWGDAITFQLTATDSPNQTRIRVTSEPISSTTLVDYGKNLDNVHRILAFLEEKQRTDQG